MAFQFTLLFLALHILCAGIWVSQFVVEVALDRFAASLKGKPGEIAVLLGEARAASLMGMIGGTGILITGLLLTYQVHYGILGLFGVYTPPWLIIKQVIFIIAMALTGSLVTRSSRRAIPPMVQALTSGQPMPAESQALIKRANLISNLVNLLVLINIFLAVYGVNGGFLT